MGIMLGKTMRMLANISSNDRQPGRLDANATKQEQERCQMLPNGLVLRTGMLVYFREPGPKSKRLERGCVRQVLDNGNVAIYIPRLIMTVEVAVGEIECVLVDPNHPIDLILIGDGL